MDRSDRDISAWDARLKEQLERSFHNYHKRRIDLSVARENEKYDWTGETLIVEKASSATATATVRLMFDDADELTLQENVGIKSIFNRIYLSNEVQAGQWLDVIAGINFEYKKKIAEAGGGDGMTLVNRGDPSSVDFTEEDLITDGAAHDLDLSGIVPAGAIAVLLLVAVMDDMPNVGIIIGKKGLSNWINVLPCYECVANGEFTNRGFVFCDENRKVGYLTHAVTFSLIEITVCGWLI